MKAFAKKVINYCCVVLVAPCGFLSFLEKKILPGSEVIFSFFAQSFALVPGIIGVFLRRSYYYQTTSSCSLNCNIGFGTILTHREVIISPGVSIGNYGVIGSVRINSGCEIGSRVSITSGKKQHTLQADGTWSSFAHDSAKQLEIGENVWIGEGAIILADVSPKTLVGAGAVVAKTFGKGCVVAGNPAAKVGDL
ncbi:acyltransferase [Desulfogranum marinum]|uniref:acyltransferase n=1 Tax=Desulfogranum marinum TaxID=453220 RepID=UPI00196596B3|nr:hypothetical protein [Desulfogranum marinum]MBM9514555.1 hypothetical protein [Desulfogranum marinum]